eukprot:4635318-Pleurochrysis_carterae.AAC.1
MRLRIDANEAGDARASATAVRNLPAISAPSTSYPPGCGPPPSTAGLASWAAAPPCPAPCSRSPASAPTSAAASASFIP